MQYLYIYLGVVSVIAAALALHDKHAAIKREWCVKERTLLPVSAIGGSVAILLAMLAIRHKTKHTKFIVGIPMIIILQIAAVLAILCWRGML